MSDDDTLERDALRVKACTLKVIEQWVRPQNWDRVAERAHSMLREELRRRTSSLATTSPVTGDLAVALAPSVLVVVESKSDLARGDAFLGAMTQIGRARHLAGGGTLTALFCFGDPVKSETLRDWLEDVVKERKKLLGLAMKVPAKTKTRASAPAKPEPKKRTQSELLEAASNYSAANLPDLVLSDAGAIAIRDDERDGSRTRYRFYETTGDAPTIVALASKVLGHVSEGIRSVEPSDQRASDKANSFKLLMGHFQAAIAESKVKALDVTDTQPKSAKSR